MTVSGGGRPDLLFERLEEGWGVEQEARSTVVQEAVVLEMLSGLTGIGTFELMKTGRPDTLGFVPDKALIVRLFQGKQALETLEIGDEGSTSAGDCTYIRLPEHNGLYRVPGHLRHFFARNLHDFRSQILLSIRPDAVKRLVLARPGADSVILEKQDSSSVWKSAGNSLGVSNDTVRTWLGLFDRLKNAPFADYFDESREMETLFASIILETGDRAETLRIFHLEPPDMPEDLTELRLKDRRLPAAFVAHSSANPLNYFALPDTNLVRALCFGLAHPSMLQR